MPIRRDPRVRDHPVDSSVSKDQPQGNPSLFFAFKIGEYSKGARPTGPCRYGVRIRNRPRANNRLVHRDLGQRKQQLVLDQVPRPDRFVTHQQGIVAFRQPAFLLDTRDQRQPSAGTHPVIECLQTALTTQLQGRHHLTTQHRPVRLITGKPELESNLARSIQQRAAQPR